MDANDEVPWSASSDDLLRVERAVCRPGMRKEFLEPTSAARSEAQRTIRAFGALVERLNDWLGKRGKQSIQPTKTQLIEASGLAKKGADPAKRWNELFGKTVSDSVAHAELHRRRGLRRLLEVTGSSGSRVGSRHPRSPAPEGVGLPG